MKTALLPLGRWEKCGLWMLAVLIIAFGFVTEMRSAFLTRRMGDVGCFFRAGWAAREGINVFDVMCDNTWHFNYPPFFAIVMAPLGDPAQGFDRAGYLPFSVSVAIFYLLNVLSLLLGVHWCAVAFETLYFPTQPRFCRRWVWLRLYSIVVCLYPIGQTLGRGQVNHFVFAALAGTMVLAVRNRRFWAGQCLALAACIKVIPVYLVVYPLWKRDGRTFLGVVAGFVALLWLIPYVYFGHDLFVRQYETFFVEFLGPSLQLKTDHQMTRGSEILQAGSTESVSLKEALHNWLHVGNHPAPREYHAAAKLGHAVLGCLMTLATLLPLLWSNDVKRNLYGFAVMMHLMTILSPVSHVHYLVFCIPLVMGNFALYWQHRDDLNLGWTNVSMNTAFCTIAALSGVPYMIFVKNYCLPLLPMLALWAMGVWRLYRMKEISVETAAVPPRHFQRAA